MNHKVLRKALEIFICKKLRYEGYIYVNDIIDKYIVDKVKELISEYLRHKRKELVNEIKAKNTIEVITSVYDEIEAFGLDSLNFDEEFSGAIIYLYLNQTSFDEEVDGNIKKRFIKENYCEEIFNKCQEYELIERNEYPNCNMGFIYNNSINVNKVNSLSHFVEKITELTNSMTINEKLFFRGHENINYLMVPQLFRGDYHEKENSMYEEIVSRSFDDFKEISSNFRRISLMQHYGLPTRLLDITLNPLIALYFACQEPSLLGEVIIFKVKKDDLKHEECDEVRVLSCLPKFDYKSKDNILSEINKDNYCGDSIRKYLREIKREDPTFEEIILKGIDITKPIFIIPNMDNKRVINQKGAYIMFGLGGEDNDSKKSKLFDIKTKEILFIEKRNKEVILKNLKICGIDKSFIFPEIDNVADDIKKSICL